jgi:hypothetical protein
MSGDTILTNFSSSSTTDPHSARTFYRDHLTVQGAEQNTKAALLCGQCDKIFREDAFLFYRGLSAHNDALFGSLAMRTPPAQLAMG